ncbi:MAG: tetratricopeptide (TPR) repeat protein [Flavobacteriaceae bacterium]
MILIANLGPILCFKNQTMKPSTELFKLIKSLTKSEKRFFKLSSSLQSGEKNYLKIFDFIERQSSYDEGQLKTEFDGETFIKHLPSEKNHLYKLILKSLRAYYSEQSISSTMKQEIKNVEILYNKALYRECEKFVSRAKATAKKYEKFYYWFELINWEKSLLESAYESGEFTTDLDKLVAEEEMVIAKLRNLAEYTIIYSKINLVFRSGGFSRNEAERSVVADIADYHLIKGKNTALSSKAASICYYIKGLCAATNRNYQDSFQFFNRTREILDDNPSIKQDSGQRYVMTLFHLLRCYIDNKQFDQARELITDIRSLAGKKGFNSVDIEVRIFGNTSIQELTLLHAEGNFDKSEELIRDIEKSQLTYGDKVSKEVELLLTYNKAYTYFGIGEYKKSLQYLNEVLNDNETNLRQDVYSFSRLFNLVIHYELGNYDFLEYVIKSTNRYLSKQSRDYKIENVCIKNIRKLAKTDSELNRLEIFEKLDVEINDLLEIRDEQAILEYFNISAWVQSKILKLSFDETIRESVK